jgi:hypothetical protein
MVLGGHVKQIAMRYGYDQSQLKCFWTPLETST